MATKTPRYMFWKPTLDGDEGLWGEYLNENWETLDALLIEEPQSDGYTYGRTNTGLSQSWTRVYTKWDIDQMMGPLSETIFVYTEVDYQVEFLKQVVMVDTSNGPVTITMPANPEYRTYVRVLDAGIYAGTNNITIARNGETIIDRDEDAVIDMTSGGFDFIYDASTWKFNYKLGCEPPPQSTLSKQLTIGAEGNGQTENGMLDGGGWLYVGSWDNALIEGVAIIGFVADNDIDVVLTFEGNAAPLGTGSIGVQAPAISGLTYTFTWTGTYYEADSDAGIDFQEYFEAHVGETTLIEFEP